MVTIRMTTQSHLPTTIKDENPYIAFIILGQSHPFRAKYKIIKCFISFKQEYMTLRYCRALFQIALRFVHQ